MRWKAGYESGVENELEQAVVGAPSAADAAARLRDVVGIHTDVIFVIPDQTATPRGTTYEDFLTQPNTRDDRVERDEDW